MFGLEQLLKVIDPDPVVISQERCLRARHARSSCRTCSDVCPEAAVSFEQRRLTVDTFRCTKCALCLGACPTAAIQVRGIDERQLDGVTLVRCQQTVGDGAVLPCLGALSVDHIVDLGSRQPGVLLLAGECETCALSSGGRRARANLHSAEGILRALGVSATPQWRTQRGGDEQTEQRAVSRRDLLGLWGQSAVQTGRTLLPDRQANPVKLPTNIPSRRLRWLQRMSPPEQFLPLPWPTRRTSQACNGCKLCTAFCPTGALGAQTEGDFWRLSFQAAACVDCGTCIGLCPRRALSPGGSPTAAEVVSAARKVIAEIAAETEKNSGSGYGGLTIGDLNKRP